MTRRVVALVLAGLAGCSSLGEGNGAVAIEVLVPVPPAVEIGDTITLRARLLNADGDSIAGTIRWRTPDTTVGVDSVSGRFWGVSGTSGKVQAVSGSLVGPLTTYSVRPFADTVDIPAAAESLFVALADTASALLAPKVLGPAAQPVADARLIFTIIFPADSSALLSGNVKADTVLSGGDGTPATPLRVRPSGATRPDSAIVKVEARRPSGAAVDTTTHRIRVFFEQ